MSIYRCTYQSMTATYGPSFIEASDAEEARRIFARRGGFALPLVSAKEVSAAEVQRALADRERQ